MKINVYETPEDITKIVKEIEDGPVTLHQSGMMFRWFKTPSLIKTLAVAEVDGKKVGAVIVSKETELECAFNIGVYVVPYHRKRGIAGKLLTTIKESVPVFRVDGSGFRRGMFKKYLDGKIE